MTNESTKDLSPIDQQWINNYVGEFLKVADSIPHGVLRDAVLRRVECVMDLVELWQKRNMPREKR